VCVCVCVCVCARHTSRRRRRRIIYTNGYGYTHCCSRHRGYNVRRTDDRSRRGCAREGWKRSGRQVFTVIRLLHARTHARRHLLRVLGLKMTRARGGYWAGRNNLSAPHGCWVGVAWCAAGQSRHHALVVSPPPRQTTPPRPVRHILYYIYIWSLCVKGAFLTLSIPTPGGPRLSDRPSVRPLAMSAAASRRLYTIIIIIIITYFAFPADAETCETGSTRYTHTLT